MASSGMSLALLKFESLPPGPLSKITNIPKIGVNKSVFGQIIELEY